MSHSIRIAGASVILGLAGAPGDGGPRVSAGIAVVGVGAEDVAIRDCEMFQCSWGFLVQGDGVAIDRVFCHSNYVFNTSPHPALVRAHRSYLRNSIFDAAGFHAYAGTMGIMLVDCSGLVIRNCHFLNQPDSGSHDQGGIDFEAHGQGSLVDACTFRNNAGAAIEVLGLTVPQTKDIEIARSRFFRNNTAHKLGPAEVFIWGRSANPDVCSSRGLVRDNGFVLYPGVVFFTNEAPHLTQWTLRDNAEFASDADDGELWRSDMVEVHVLPAGTTVARAWGFSRPLDKEGWTEVSTGTRTQEWENSRSLPVKYVGGGHYIVAVDSSPDAHLLSPDDLDLDAARCTIVTVRLQNRTPAARMRLRFTTDDAPIWDDARSRDVALVPDDAGTRVYRVDMAGAPGWTGRVKRMRIDLATGAPLTGTFRLDYVWVGQGPR